jgi:hypothetical protein
MGESLLELALRRGASAPVRPVAAEPAAETPHRKPPGYRGPDAIEPSPIRLRPVQEPAGRGALPPVLDAELRAGLRLLVDAARRERMIRAPEA